MVLHSITLTLTIPGDLIMRQSKSYLLLLLLSLSGCGTLTIWEPQPGLIYADPLAVSVSASANIEIGSVRATLDGRDVSNNFVFGSGTRSVSAVLQTTPGQHSLTVSAKVWNGWYRTYDPKSAQVSFNTAPGGSIALTISPQTLTLAPGTSQPIAVSITRGGAFQDDVTVSDGGSSIVIPASSTAGTLNIGVAGNAYPGEGTRGISADGRLYASRLYDQKALRLRVGHQPGPFSRALTVASSANQVVLGPDNLTTVSVQNAPPGAPRFEARFRQPTGPLGAPIGFEPGTPVSGGAGFCPHTYSAFVISGGSATSDHTATFFFLNDPLPRIPLTIPATVAGGPVVEPTLFFSKNCAIVIAVGADTTTQQAFRAQVYDLHRKNQICSIAFNAAPTSLQALMDSPANDNQKLTVTVGGQSTDCLLFP